MLPTELGPAVWSGGPERGSPGGGAGRKLSQIFHACDKVKTNLGQPTGLKYELDKDVLSLAEALSPHPNLVWTTLAQTLFHVICSHPSTASASLKGWAQSCRPHGHACNAKWIYHRRAQLCATGCLGPNFR